MTSVFQLQTVLSNCNQCFPILNGSFQLQSFQFKYFSNFSIQLCVCQTMAKNHLISQLIEGYFRLTSGCSALLPVLVSSFVHNNYVIISQINIYRTVIISFFLQNAHFRKKIIFQKIPDSASAIFSRLPVLQIFSGVVHDYKKSILI